jgi:hypothetical protein
MRRKERDECRGEKVDLIRKEREVSSFVCWASGGKTRGNPLHTIGTKFIRISLVEA